MPTSSKVLPSERKPDRSRRSPAGQPGPEQSRDSNTAYSVPFRVNDGAATGTDLTITRPSWTAAGCARPGSSRAGFGTDVALGGTTRTPHTGTTTVREGTLLLNKGTGPGRGERDGRARLHHADANPQSGFAAPMSSAGSAGTRCGFRAGDGPRTAASTEKAVRGRSGCRRPKHALSGSRATWDLGGRHPDVRQIG